MEQLYANTSVSISELKKNPSAIIESAEGFPVAVLNHNRPAAYLVPVAAFEAMMEQLDDQALARLIKERQAEATVKVSLDDL
ncbi:MAG TPA: type II toxin-antitoxin system prevent-host-death family antitoxin [Novimethylophilus sp.]|jgi:antitoxin StbD|uniref:type II toxin-antitoxin system Phd/YefM family antitoxin n=1 Tax=Novimethylophilus sp. TaxID=2137426 RepID=UPI002F406D30